MTATPSLTPAAIEAVCGRLEEAGTSLSIACGSATGTRATIHVTRCRRAADIAPEAATLIRALAARVEALEAGLRELGACGSCAGGNYLNKWVGADGYHEEIVPCRKCNGTGVNPVAAHLLAGGGE